MSIEIHSPKPAELCLLVKNLCQATTSLTIAVNKGRSINGHCRAEKLAIIALLTELFGRKP